MKGHKPCGHALRIQRQIVQLKCMQRTSSNGEKRLALFDRLTARKTSPYARGAGSSVSASSASSMRRKASALVLGINGASKWAEMRIASSRL